MDFESIWRGEYEVSRYLRNATNELLDERLSGISANLWSTGQHGEITPLDSPLSGRAYSSSRTTSYWRSSSVVYRLRRPSMRRP